MSDQNEDIEGEDASEGSEASPVIPEDASEGQAGKIIAVDGMFDGWFLDYASYVILDRSVPHINDGLKPVQRRILHAMRELEDGRYNKVANIIGAAMAYHPHGDAAIGDAIVNLGQKELLIDTQGNWGDVVTGDRAAAARYIEARLSKFALEVAFNPQTTDWQLSYDGRKREPTTLPMKFPLLLAQGVEGIAVGLSTKILPHNFQELCQAVIAYYKGKLFTLYPDFQQGGMADIGNYNDGMRGGRVRVRAKIEELDKKTLIIREVPFGTTTSNLVDSIVKMTEEGKLKVKKVIDNTAANVEIVIHLAPGVSPDLTIDALFAFTECEMKLAPNACVVHEAGPRFMSVSDLLRYAADQTRELLKRELEIRLAELETDWHMSSLERIFIENRIYRDIEEETTWEGVLSAIDRGLEPFKPSLRRAVLHEDLLRLTEIKIKRISKFDAFKAEEHIRGVEEEMQQVQHHLEHLTDYAIAYYQGLLKKYGPGRERKTELRAFDTIQAQAVAIANQKLYVNKKEGFIGTGASLRKDEYALDVSELDWIATFRKDGTMMVTRVAEKTFVGKDIDFVDVYRKDDDRKTYHMLYTEKATGIAYAKRFRVEGVVLGKEYPLTKGPAKVEYFSILPNAEAEQILIVLHPLAKAKVKEILFDFGALAIKGRSANGNIATKYPIRRVIFKSKGGSTVGGRQIWYDEIMGRLNTDGRGELLGSFDGEDRLLAVYMDGTYELLSYELTHRFEPAQLKLLIKHEPEQAIAAVYFEGGKRETFAKRFLIDTTTLNKRFSFIGDAPGAKLDFVAVGGGKVRVTAGKATKKQAQTVKMQVLEDLPVMGRTALGTRLALEPVLSVELLEAFVSNTEPIDQTLPLLTKEEPSEVVDATVTVEWEGEAVKPKADEPPPEVKNGTLF